LKIVAHLNSAQHRAVSTTEGPVLVLAGAGTGKTRVVTVRIAHLLKKGVPPEAVLAMTFTNKAAREMRERVAELVGKKKAERIFVGTFHAFCIDLLRKYGEAVGVGRFTISDGSDQLSIVRSLLREVAVDGVSLQPGQVQSRISLLKNRLEDPKRFLDGAADDADELVGRVWRRYEAQLRRTRSLDFDDILLYALKLLRKKDGPRAELRERFRYVMVDEYQDTNAPQYEIVRAIAGGHRNLCVVGDDDQSIYGWRGADVKKILGFEKDFEGAEVVKLETNYRSTAEILKAANRVIRNNPGRHEKTLVSHLGEGHALQLTVADDEMEEADWVVREIQSLVRREKARLGEFAILFRTGPQARAFESSLRARGVRYVLVGGMSFFDRKEVRDVVAWLKLVVNPADETSLLRMIDAPPRGLGKASVDRILAFGSTRRLTALEAFERADEVEGVPASAANAARELFRTLATLRDRKGSLVKRVEDVLEAVSYRAEVNRSYPDELTRTARWAAVEEILNFAENHQKRRKQSSLATFLQELALEADDDPTAEDEKNRDAVTLMTLHAAKGLEYPRVYLVGLEEGLLPHARAVLDDTVEEERRLCYVGITRARQHLTFTLTKTRARHGRRTETMPSRFLFELKDEKPPAGWVAAGTVEPAAGRRKKKPGGRGRRAVRR
jgi:superfamily I DNA/RNA helicase